MLNFGNKSSFDSSSALDRINTARLVAYLRRQFAIAARPFIFEPNDPSTWKQISSVFDTIMVDLVAKRAVIDYIVVCDSSTNTPERIDRHELWIDVAFVPDQSVEFIYVPVRLYSSGQIPSIA